MSSVFIDEDNVSNSFNFVFDDDDDKEEISSDREEEPDEEIFEWLRD